MVDVIFGAAILPPPVRLCRNCGLKPASMMHSDCHKCRTKRKISVTEDYIKVKISELDELAIKKKELEEELLQPDFE